MRKGDKKLFLDGQKLYELINLRINGWGVTSLSNYFACDVSSIRYQCTKYNIEPGETIVIERIVSKILPQEPRPTYREMPDGERINLGKSYKEYILEAQRSVPKMKISP